MSYKLELSPKQFIKLFGHKKYVKNLSEESVAILLDYLGDTQDVVGNFDDIKWKPVFKKSRELDNETVVKENEHMMGELGDKLLTNSSRLLGLSIENYALIDDEDEPNRQGVFNTIRADLEMATDWNEVAAEVIGKAMGYTELSSGNHLIIGVDEPLSNFLNLSTVDFIEKFGENEHVKYLSVEVVGILLDYVKNIYKDSHCLTEVNWEQYFEEARVVDVETIEFENKDCDLYNKVRDELLATQGSDERLIDVLAYRLDYQKLSDGNYLIIDSGN